jgi:hypothetical protein
MKLDFNEDDLMQPWRFKSEITTPTDAYAVGNLTFTPQTIFNKKVNYLLIRSVLNQVFGVWNGEI